MIGSTGDLLDRLDGQDVVTFTGSADTAAKLRAHPQPACAKSIPFNAEADSLNCAILAPDVTPDDEEFDLFVKEVAREMTVKAGQKCTAIRRAIVPRQHLDAVAEKLRERLAKIVVGDPAVEGVRMGALASRAQQDDVAERVAMLAQGNELVFGARDGFAAGAARAWRDGAFFAPTLLLCRDAADERRGARRRGLRPGQHADALRRHRRSAWRWPRAAAAAWSARWSRTTRRSAAQGGARGRRAARPPARARPRSGGRVHRPRLAAAAAQARRPGPRRRRRGAGRHPRREALPAARRGAGLADDADAR